jgi:superfamily II DNA or RNA helicase/HKD family nuclease
MKPGLYESLVTEGVERAVRDSPDALAAEREPLEEGSAPHVLGRYLFDALVRTMRNLPEKDRAGAQVALTNRLVDLMQEVAPQAGIDEDERVVDPAQLLLSLRAASEQRLGVAGLPRPTLPLRHSDLLVNGPRDLRLGPQIRGELASADAVDVLVSFVKWNGVRLVRSELAQFAARHPGRLRVLTTTYMGATEPDALDLLQELGAEVRVSYDARRTRLHAKAWLFHRDSGFSTALIGSSNLSPSAMLDGCEWNVRLSAIDNKTILDKFVVTFLQYWGDTQAFEPYERARFVEATRRRDPERDALARAVTLRPYPHQQAALDALATERRNGHHRNLVVAATGTGKTVVAALDYARLRQELGNDPTLLFVAHSEEILSQSLAMYRAALRDGNFGELRVGARRPVEGRHVFSSIQSLHEDALAKLQTDAYDVVVIDEFHHAAAPSYERLLGHLSPKVLLGLTATPERTDGKSVLGWFDGRIAAELRLWDALELGLLSPFQYFGVHDATDLSRVDFSGGRYDIATLEKLYTADHVRAKAVLAAIQRYVRDPQTMRALGFCVSVAHARFMAAFINQLAPGTGLRALAVDGESSDQDRRAALQQLREGSVNLVFTVNLFNEGVDVPAVDTVLFLRPTESATLFLQQLGRGLRLEEGKSCLTVLDLIGSANRKFRYADRFKALTRGTRAAVERAVEEGFPHLPAGCEIRLDEASQRAVLANLKEALRNDWKELAKDLRALGSVRLPVFLREVGLELEEFYARPRRTFVGLAHEAGLRPGPVPDNELTRALGRLLYLDDEGRLDLWRGWLAQSQPPPSDLDDPLQLMLFAVLGQARRPVAELPEVLAELWAGPELREELADLLALLADQQRRPTFPLRGLPFRVHASYSRDEIAAGLRQTRSGKLLRTQGGVFKCDDASADVLYVEIDKDPKHYTPTTFYDDHPLSPTLFQWESQSKTRANSETGQRYQRPPPGWRTLLFVRQRADDGRGNTSPYLFLGPVRYVSHEGEKPMKIVWELERPMPPEFFGEVKIAAG